MLPTGTVTFLFTDIERSTHMWQEFPDEMKSALLRHDEILRNSIESNGGYVFKTVGDSFCAAFKTAIGGLNGALQAQLALNSEPWDPLTPIRVRMALHTGEAVERDRDYYGPAVNRSARLESIGYGGQTLVSLVTAELIRDTLPRKVSLKEMGARRLKDLTRPERVYQLIHPDLPEDFPALKSLDSHHHNMPVQPTTLVGRQAEIGIVESMLSSAAEPLVTLTGPGGMGKTRLALQVGAELIDHFDDGVFFVDLSPVKEAALLPATISQVLHLRESESRPFLAVLKEYLKNRKMLLILDNFEQIMSARDIVVELTTSCATLKIIVTSREPLHIRGEKVFGVPSLSMPEEAQITASDTDTATQYEAVRLFIERAVAAKQDFEVTNDNAPSVAEICVRLDGIPLAIELAAARIRLLLTPEAILKRLGNRLKLLKGGINDLPERQKTLRATINWSYEMLDDDCKQLFAYLSVYSGGFSLDAAETLCAGMDTDANVFDGVESLVDKSFIFPENSGSNGPRYHILETLREYGIEKLKEEGAFERLRNIHADFYKSLVGDLCSELRGKDLKSSLDTLDVEYANIRDSISWLHIRDKSKEVLEICGSIWRFWQIRGHLAEGREQIDRALKLASDEDDTLIAGALLGAGTLAKEQGDHNAAMQYLERGKLSARGKSLASMAIAIDYEIGNLFYRMDRIKDARIMFLAVLREATERNDEFYRARACIGLGAVYWRRDDLDTAKATFNECVRIARSSGDDQILAQAICNLGIIAREEKTYKRAKSLYLKAVQLLEPMEDHATLRGTYNNLGDIYLLLNDNINSRLYYTKLLVLAEDVGDRRLISTAHAGLAESHMSDRNLDQAHEHALAAYDNVSKLEIGIEAGVSLRLLGQVHLMQNEVHKAKVFIERCIPILSKFRLRGGTFKSRKGVVSHRKKRKK